MFSKAFLAHLLSLLAGYELNVHRANCQMISSYNARLSTEIVNNSNILFFLFFCSFLQFLLLFVYVFFFVGKKYIYVYIYIYIYIQVSQRKNIFLKYFGYCLLLLKFFFIYIYIYIYILIHIVLCRWVSDEKMFTWFISGNKTTFFGHSKIIFEDSINNDSDNTTKPLNNHSNNSIYLLVQIETFYIMSESV